MQATVLDVPAEITGFPVLHERRMFMLPARVRIEGADLPCAVELRLTYSVDQVIVEELVLRRETGEQLPITAKTLRAIRLEEVRRRALEAVTCVLIPDPNWPFGLRPGPAPWQTDTPQNEMLLKALGMENLPAEMQAARRAGSTRRAIAAATKKPRRPGRGRSLDDAEMKRLARMVGKGADVKAVQAEFSWLSRSTAYRLMAEARKSAPKKSVTKKGRKR